MSPERIIAIMTHYYTQYWSSDWLKNEDVIRGKILNHTAGNLFRKTGVEPGDVVYIVTLDTGQLYLIGRIKVGRIYSQEEANKEFGDNLWEAKEHIIAKKGTETSMRHNGLVPLETVRDLKFINSKGEVNLKFETGNKLDKQTLRGVRKLSRQSVVEFDKLFNHVETALEEIELFKKSNPNLKETSREAIIQSRIGQGQFRTSLIEYWKECSVSSCKQIELLRASHIKPWRFSSNTQRLDLYNGLLLLPNLDACFDSGWISFQDNGNILISSRLDETTLLHLGINSSMKLSRVDKRHIAYLKFHRENVFRG